MSYTYKPIAVVGMVMAVILASLPFVREGWAANKIIRVMGAPAAMTLAEPLMVNFMHKNPDTSVVLVGVDTGTGLKRLCSGESEVALASRPATPAELRAAEEKGIKLEANETGYEDTLVVVNRKNPVESLTMEQFQNIYAGKIQNWKDVGGADQSITVYAPTRGESGDAEEGNATCFLNTLVSTKAKPYTGHNALFFLIGGPQSGDQGAVGMISGRELDNQAKKGNAGMVKILKIARDRKSPAILPQIDSHGKTDYALQCPIYAYYNANSGVGKEFVEFCRRTLGTTEKAGVENSANPAKGR